MFLKTRSGFTTADYEFIAWTLGSSPADREDIVASCADPAAATAFLRDSRLFERSMTPPPVFLGISPGLFFYIFVFRALDRKSLADDDVVDYVSGICAEFRSAGPLFHVSSHEGAFFYMTDLMNLMEDLDGPRRHLLRRYIGDATLFLTGFFPGFFTTRSARRGAPPIGFYLELARSQYSDASMDPDARAEETAGVLSALSERFTDVSAALSELSEECNLIGRRSSPQAGAQGSQLVV